MCSKCGSTLMAIAERPEGITMEVWLEQFWQEGWEFTQTEYCQTCER